MALDPIILSLLILPLVRLLLGKRMNGWVTGLACVDAIVLVLVVFLAIRRELQADGAMRARATPQEAYKWRASWGPDLFLRHLSLFVRLRGWRIISTRVMSPDRAALVAQKENHRLALLCIRPEARITDADLDTLADVQAQANASRGILVSNAATPTTRKPAPLLQQAPLVFHFEDLDRLDEALGLCR